MARLGSVGLFSVPFCAERRDNPGDCAEVFLQLELGLRPHSMFRRIVGSANRTKPT